MSYDKWKLSSNTESDKVFCNCEYCDGEIYVGEEYLRTDYGNIHQDCFNDFSERLLNPSIKIAEND